MDLTENKLSQAVQVLRRMGAKRVVLFGSFATDPTTAADVDLAVEGPRQPRGKPDALRHCHSLRQGAV